MLNSLGGSWEKELKECGGDKVGADQRDALSCKALLIVRVMMTTIT